MLPRTQSIFHIGEEGWEATKPTAAFGELERSSRGAIEGLEGLRIVIQHSTRRSNVVIKSSLNSCMPHHLLSLRATSATQSGFLKTCFLCKTELSPHKDVYMYRGDQGFCSEECRGHQILIDERKEMEVSSTRERLKATHHRCLHESGRHRRRRRRRILVAA
ncbi:FCS-Like Zinc finger 17-like isoform X2 [Curcuma longa]|uniref:FCS-Like Zinc finger 17-like isoform X2 n=1 Tax=Curcuma longa TaxID=136217 RepID=UPI003D9DCD0F